MAKFVKAGYDDPPLYENFAGLYENVLKDRESIRQFIINWITNYTAQEKEFRRQNRVLDHWDWTVGSPEMPFSYLNFQSLLENLSIGIYNAIGRLTPRGSVDPFSIYEPAFKKAHKAKSINEYIELATDGVYNTIRPYAIKRVQGEQAVPQIEARLDNMQHGGLPLYPMLRDSLSKFLQHYPEFIDLPDRQLFLLYNKQRNDFHRNPDDVGRDGSIARHLPNTWEKLYGKDNVGWGTSNFRHVGVDPNAYVQQHPEVAKIMDAMASMAADITPHDVTAGVSRFLKYAMATNPELIVNKFHEFGGNVLKLTLWAFDPRIEQMSDAQLGHVVAGLKHIEKRSFLDDSDYPRVRIIVSAVLKFGDVVPIIDAIQTSEERRKQRWNGTQPLDNGTADNILNGLGRLVHTDDPFIAERGFRTFRNENRMPNEAIVPDESNSHQDFVNLMNNRHSEMNDQLFRSFTNFQKLHDVVERVYRVKRGTPEHERLFQMLAYHPNLVGVTADDYEDFRNTGLQYGDKYTDEVAAKNALSRHTDFTPFNQLASFLGNPAEGQNDRVAQNPNSHNEMKSAFENILGWFKNDWRRALSAFAQKNHTSNMSDAVHQFGAILPPYNARHSKNGVREYYWQWINRSQTEILKAVLASWDQVAPEEKKLPPFELLTTLAKRSELNQVDENGNGSIKDMNFLAETLRHDPAVEPDKYREWEDTYLQGLNVPLPAWAQARVEEVGPNGKKYIGRFLPRNDPRSLHLGNYANCCQHVDGAGEFCARHSHTSPYGAAFVVENEEGDVIAISWVWEAQKGELVFDNIEAKGVGSRMPTVVKIFEEAAATMGADEVRIGGSMNKINVDHLPFVKNPISYGYDENEEEEEDEDGEEWGSARIPNDDWADVPYAYPRDFDFGDENSYSDAITRQHVLKNQGEVYRSPNYYAPARRNQEVEEDNSAKWDANWMTLNPFAPTRSAYIQHRAIKAEMNRLARTLEDLNFFEEADQVLMAMLSIDHITTSA